MSEAARPRGPRWRRADAVSGAVFLAVALGAWLAGRDLPVGSLHRPGAGLFPRGLAALLAVLSAVLLVRGLGRPGADLRGLWQDRAGARRLLLMGATLLGYVAIVEVAGYLITTFALFVVMIRWVGARGWPVALATAGLGSAGSYLLFARALKVNLPAGLWLP